MNLNCHLRLIEDRDRYLGWFERICSTASAYILRKESSPRQNSIRTFYNNNFKLKFVKLINIEVLLYVDKSLNSSLYLSVTISAARSVGEWSSRTPVPLYLAASCPSRTTASIGPASSTLLRILMASSFRHRHCHLLPWTCALLYRKLRRSKIQNASAASDREEFAALLRATITVNTKIHSEVLCDFIPVQLAALLKTFDEVLY